MVHYVIDPPTAYPKHTWVGIFEKGQRRNKQYLSSAYGNESSTILMKAPRAPGDYEVRLFVSGSTYNDQTTSTFSIEDHDFVKTSSEVAFGGSINVQFQMFTCEPSTSDWIGIFQGDQPNNKYLASAYTTGASTGEISIPAPKQAGVYECRLFSHSLGKYTTFRVSQPFTVLPAPSSVDVASTSSDSVSEQ